MNICDRATMKNCIKYQATDIISQDQYYDVDNTLLIDVKPKRYFVATLPDGRYQADFLNATTGKRVWPTHAVEHYSDVSCKGASGGYLEEGSIWIPPLSLPIINSICTRNLLRTESQYWIGGVGDIGDMEVIPATSTTPMLLCEALPPPSWTIEQRQQQQQFMIGQYLDTRCLVEKQEYEVTFHIQLMHLSTEIPSEVVSQQTLLDGCSSNGGSSGGLCPEVGILFTSHDGTSKWIHKLQYTTATDSAATATAAATAAADASGDSEPEIMAYGDLSMIARPRSGGDDAAAAAAAASTTSVSIESNGVYFIGVHDYDDPNERLRRSLRGKQEDKKKDGDVDSEVESEAGSEASGGGSSSSSSTAPSTAPYSSEANATIFEGGSSTNANTNTNTFQFQFQFRGTFFLDYRMSDASNAFFFIRRGKDNVDIYDSNQLCMDSLSIQAKV